MSQYWVIEETLSNLKWVVTESLLNHFKSLLKLGFLKLLLLGSDTMTFKKHGGRLISINFKFWSESYWKSIFHCAASNHQVLEFFSRFTYISSTQCFFIGISDIRHFFKVKSQLDSINHRMDALNDTTWLNFWRLNFRQVNKYYRNKDTLRKKTYL